jgi:hypothetical protein
MKRLKLTVFNLYIALNMLTCAIVFAPWALPRETISGFMGRTLMSSVPGTWKCLLAAIGCNVIDWLYFWEEDHCFMVFKDEAEARAGLYPHL